MSGTIYSSQVPAAVIQRILSEAWLSPLTTSDRIALMTSSPLVNKEWAAIFNVISHRDIYVPTTSYFIQKLLPILEKRVKSQLDLKLTCRSISVTIEYAKIFPDIALTVLNTVPIPSYVDEPLMGHTFRTLMLALSERYYTLPNLRAISVEFVNIGLDDVFVNDRFFRFPTQVTDLEFKFTYHPLVPVSLIKELRANQAQHDFSKLTGPSARAGQVFHDGKAHPCFPSVRHLRILGGSEATIADAVSQCPALETLELEISGKPSPSRFSTHLVSLCNPLLSVDSPNPTDVALSTIPALAIKSSPSDMTPEVWYGVHVDDASGVRQFRRPALAPVAQRRGSHFMSRAKKPFSRIFASASLKKKGISSH